MPNIETVHISGAHQWLDDPWLGGDGLPRCTRTPCPRRWRDAGRAKILLHSSFPPPVQYGSPNEVKERAFAPFLEVMRTLSMANHPLKKLSINGAGLQHGVPMEAFYTSLRHWLHLINVLQHVQTPCLELGTYGGLATTEDYFRQGKVASTLASAKNLRSLKVLLHPTENISMPQEGASGFSAVLRNCHFPKLDTVWLGLSIFLKMKFYLFFVDI